MAEDMTYLTKDSSYTAIADAIRSKTGETGTMKPGEMPAKISAISGGGGDIQAVTPPTTKKFACMNIFEGTVISKNDGAVNGEIYIQLNDDSIVTVSIPIYNMDEITVQETVQLVIPSKEIIVSTTAFNASLSTFSRTVNCTSVTRGAVTVEVTFETTSGLVIYSNMSDDRYKELSISVNKSFYVGFNQRNCFVLSEDRQTCYSEGYWIYGTVDSIDIGATMTIANFTPNGQNAQMKIEVPLSVLKNTEFGTGVAWLYLNTYGTALFVNQ